MIYIIWEFQVNPQLTSEFEQTYGPQGKWSTLFQKSKNYHGTTLIKDTNKPGRYLTIDSWNQLSDFDQFKKEFSKEYESLDQSCEKLTLSENKIGIFEKI